MTGRGTACLSVEPDRSVACQTMVEILGLFENLESMHQLLK